MTTHRTSPTEPNREPPHALRDDPTTFFTASVLSVTSSSRGRIAGMIAASMLVGGTAHAQQSSLLHLSGRAPMTEHAASTPRGWPPRSTPETPRRTTSNRPVVRAAGESGPGAYAVPGNNAGAGSRAVPGNNAGAGSRAGAGRAAGAGQNWGFGSDRRGTPAPLPDSAYAARPLMPPGGTPGAAPTSRPTVEGGASLRSTSWTYRPEPRMRTFAVNDIVTIRVDEIARILAEGDAESRKNTLFRGILTDWIALSKGRIRPNEFEDGNPAMGTQSDDTYRSQSSIESRESLSFNIAATVVDIRPNGNLVLEARKSYRVNDNLWETSLTGICRVEDIGPDNIALSRDLIDLQIRKQDQGHLRDKYRRGWLTRMLDRFRPF